MNPVAFPVIVFVAGIATSLQGLFLGVIRMRRGVIHAARVSFLGTFIGVAAVMFAQVSGARRYLLLGGAIVAMAMLIGLMSKTRWYLGGVGLLGAIYLGASAAGVAALGAGVTVAIIVGGQMFASLTLDRMGALGIERRPLSAKRVAGAALIVLGVVLVRFG